MCCYLTRINICCNDVVISRALHGFTNDSWVQTMKKEILKEVSFRFADVMKEPLYAIATVVDPRYRGKLLPANDGADGEC